MMQVMRTLRDRWQRPVPALPIDMFRVLVGLLSTVYFVHLGLQTGDISSPDGLIDHTLVRDIFWYTKMGLFRPGITANELRVIFAAAAGASLALAAGWRPKIMAAFMFVIAVSAYRWNFIVIYVDDAIMHLAMFWMLLLPIGSTLVLRDYTRERQGALERWRATVVPGAAVRAFLISLSLVYVVAGMWKWTSPMWRSGTALFAALQTPVAWMPAMWTQGQLPFISIADYTTLILEPAFPLMFVLRRNHPLKWGLLIMMIGFHVGIVATMKVPYANIACLAAIVVIFRDEIMMLLTRGRTLRQIQICSPATRLCTAGSLSFVTVLTLAMIGEAAVPAWRGPNRAEEANVARGRTARHAGFLGSQHNPMYLPLWGIGIAQSYRLFDWIDDRNFRVNYSVTETRPDGSARSIEPEEIFPVSIRGVLLQSYMHDITWGSLPRERADDMKIALFARFAHRYCKAHADAGDINVLASVGRVPIDRPAPFPAATPFMRFSCAGTEERLVFARLGRDRVVTSITPRFNASLVASGGH